MSLLNNLYNESPTKAKSRLKIIKNAFTLFTDEGIDSVSIASIAEKSDLTIRNLYRYYPNKESLITDVAYHYISIFNNIHKISISNQLSGYEQLSNVLKKQIKDKFITEDNRRVIAFISYFDIYMTRSNIEHESIKNYIDVYSPLLRENLLQSIKQALVKGVIDNTLSLKEDEVDSYVKYIFHSLMSIVSRIALKSYENDIQKFDLVQKHIEVLLKHLKK